MADWMKDEQHTGRKVVVTSLKTRIAGMTAQAEACRIAYEKDYMRVPCEFLADALADAAKVLQSRLDAVIGHVHSTAVAKHEAHR